MRIVDIRERTVPIAAPYRNADIRFDDMTASAVVVVSDRRRDGKPLVGLAFDSIGRYGHGHLLRERFAPRLLAADPEDYSAERGDSIDPVRAWQVAMRNEKPGGDGDRAGAVGILDAALWDLAAKAQKLPLHRLLADRFNAGRSIARVPVYASGGHYAAERPLQQLEEELETYRARGYRRMKIKIGGAPLEEDLRRIDTALRVVGAPAELAVDANAAFDRDTAFRYAEALAPIGLAWLEEPAHPLDYELYNEICRAYPHPVATGENLFSVADTRNLLRYAGLRREHDRLQMDVSLSYGVTGYLRLVDAVEAMGWSRHSLVPHAGHLLSLHTVAGLGLGGHEAAPDPSRPFGGFPDGVEVADGTVAPPDAPGVGIETKTNLYAVFAELLP